MINFDKLGKWGGIFRLIFPLLIILPLIAIGTMGFYIIEKQYTFFDAFYMTMITISTVGFTEVHSLTESGRMFTVFLIVISFGTFAYALSEFTRMIVDGEFNKYFKRQQINAMLESLENHVIICGYGRNGRQAANVLRMHKRAFVVIEKTPGPDEDIPRYLDELVIYGDATSDEILNKAGISRANALITTLPKDADNVFIVLSARALNAGLTIISRASEENSDKKLRIAGANNVIMPDKVGGAHMASLVMKPDIIEFIDVMTGQEGDMNNLVEISLLHFGNTTTTTLKELNLHKKTGVNVIGLKKPEDGYVVNPDEETVITPQTKLFVLGSAGQLKVLKRLIEKEYS